jgi:hypothetical protein
VSISVGRESILSVVTQAEDARRRNKLRCEREERMRNALDMLAYSDTRDFRSPRAYAMFVRAAARDGLGHDKVA